MARSQGYRDVLEATGFGGHHASDPIAGLRGDAAVARQHRTYWCRRGHDVTLVFAADVPAPSFVECRHCGSPAGLYPRRPARHRHPDAV